MTNTPVAAVLFDWGDTVMRVFPEYDGPMVEWPRVEALPDVETALRALAPHYRMALATNAGASGAAQVWGALERAGLQGYFQAVFTAHELHARKPEPFFYESCVRALGCAAGATAMVGDDYAADVAGAKAGGLRAVWFNAAGRACPVPHPQHDAEVRALADLPAALAALRLPDEARCLAWLEQHALPVNAVRHSRATAAVAFRLAEALRARGLPVDPLLAHRGALLHDMDKISSRRAGRPHGQEVGEFLRAQGLGDLARIAERHPLFTVLAPETRPQSWEEKAVYYADKLVAGEELAGLGPRLEDLEARYPDAAARIRACEPLVRALEAEICAALGVPDEELLHQLHAGVAGAT